MFSRRELESIYKNVSNEKLEGEFWDCVEKWQQKYTARDGWTPHEALTVMWGEADSRGLGLPDCDSFGLNTKEYGRW